MDFDLGVRVGAGFRGRVFLENAGFCGFGLTGRGAWLESSAEILERP